VVLLTLSIVTAAGEVMSEETAPLPSGGHGGISRRTRRGVPPPVNWDELAGQWHPTRNSGSALRTYTPGSSQRFWWRCELGHEWRAAIGGRVHGSGCPYCAHRGPDAATPDTCLAAVNPQLAAQWHPTRNDARTASDVLPWSSARVWWRCEHGHEWRMTVSAGSSSRRCPFCSGRRASAENNLTITAPDIAAQWHPTRNSPLTAREVTSSSGRRIWWRCERGHEWRSPVRVRRTGGCARCSRRRPSAEHNLAAAAPQIAAQWHPDLNGERSPQAVAPRSHVRAWWRCARGHVWQATVVSRTKSGSGCPVCARETTARARDSLPITHPALAAQWHPDLNCDITAAEVTYGSSRKVWWLCSENHSWRAQIGNRARGSGCPYCAGKLPTATNNLAVQNPALAAQWHPTRNDNLTPVDITPYVGVKAWWHCSAGHEWPSRVADRNRQGHGCPYCSGHLPSLTNNLATGSPALAAQWHPTRNGPLQPTDVTVASSRQVHWFCGRGHAWRAAISNRSRGVGCPYCAGKLPTATNNLAVQNPELAAQWHPTRNDNLTPVDVTPVAGRRVAWLCGCGYQWVAQLNNRQRAAGCPCCHQDPPASAATT